MRAAWFDHVRSKVRHWAYARCRSAFRVDAGRISGASCAKKFYATNFSLTRKIHYGIVRTSLRLISAKKEMGASLCR